MDSKEKARFTCPIDKAVVLFNKKWTIQIIRDMFFGKKHFSEFQENKPELSNKVLSQRLKELCDEGLVEKKIVNDSPIVVEYNLTDYGRSLNKVIYELAVFILDKSDYSEYEDEETKNQIKTDFREALHV